MELYGDRAGLYGLAERGMYYRAINPTPGTGIAQSIQASFLATNGALYIGNGATGGDTRRIFLDYVRLIPTVVPASATRSEMLVALDDIVRYASGGSLLTVRNVNMDDVTPSIAEVRFGALTLAAEGANVRRVSRAQLRTAIPVAFEEFLLTFAGFDRSGAGSIAGATGLRVAVPVGPVIIGPGDSLVLHLWHPGNVTTAASWEVEVALWEARKWN